MRDMISAVWMTFMVLALAGQPSAEDEVQDWIYIPPVVASVDGEDISADAFVKLYSQMAKDDLESGRKEPTESTEERKKDVLEQLVIRELLSQRADELNIQAYPGQIQNRLQAVESRLGGRGYFDKYLTEIGMSREEYLADVESAIRTENLLKMEVYDSVSVDPDEAREYYASHPEEFQVPEQIRGRHILIEVKDATDAERKAAKARIEKAAERIREGEPFEEVAREVSEESAAVRGGDMGYVAKGQMKAEFEEIAFSLEVGEVSKPFETEYGYHLIKVEDRIPPASLSFETVRPRVEQYLKQKKGKAMEEEYIERLREEAVIFRAEF